MDKFVTSKLVDTLHPVIATVLVTSSPHRVLVHPSVPGKGVFKRKEERTTMENAWKKNERKETQRVAWQQESEALSAGKIPLVSSYFIDLF
jgi:hypothetical protein